jgi:hypothetical protein
MPAARMSLVPLRFPQATWRWRSSPRVTVPVSPYFLSEVHADKVQWISSTGDTIDGTFTTRVLYPDGECAS